MYPVQLDTGSSDLCALFHASKYSVLTPLSLLGIKGEVSPLPNTEQTVCLSIQVLTAILTTSQSVSYNLSYGVGWAYGNVGFGTVEFSGWVPPLYLDAITHGCFRIQIENQSFLDVSDANNPALGYGAQGLIGLGFTSLSNIDYAINRTGSSSGRSFLFNAFSVDSQEPNFISFVLSRSSDDQDELSGAMTIGEYVQGYEQIEQTPAISTWPIKNPARWNVLLEAIHVGTKPTTVTSKVPNAPANRAVALLDTGTSYTYAPPEVCQAIYGGIPGATYDPNSQLWLLPCNQEVDVALQIKYVRDRKRTTTPNKFAANVSFQCTP